MAETIIEIAGKQNESVMFGPLNRDLRGRWSHAAIAGVSTHESLRAMHIAAPVIPGIHLAIDPKARTCRMFDPLRETAEGRQIWEAVSEVFEQYRAFFSKWKTWEPVAIENADNNTLKTWAFEMRNLLECGYARHVSGPELPPLEEIRKIPGGRRVHVWIGGAATDRNQLEDVVAAGNGGGK